MRSRLTMNSWLVLLLTLSFLVFPSNSPENPLLGRGGAERQRSRSDSGRVAPGWFVPAFKNPLKSPLIQGRTVFSSNVAPQRGMKNSPKNEIQFVDVASEAGVQPTIHNGGPEKKWIPEANGTGAAWLDYDNDGRLDLLIVNGSSMDALPGIVSGQCPSAQEGWGFSLSKPGGRPFPRRYSRGPVDEFVLGHRSQRRRLRQRWRYRRPHHKHRGGSSLSK